MRVLYDYRGWQAFENRGVANYISGLFSSCMKHNNDDVYILIDKSKNIPSIECCLNKVIYLCIADIKGMKYGYHFFDCYFGGSAFIPTVKPEEVFSELYPSELYFACTKMCMIVYDFIPVFFPMCVMNEQTKVSFVLQQEALRTFDCLFTDSMFTKYVAELLLDFQKDRIHCIYGGVNEERFKEAPCIDYESRKDCFVYVSGAAEHKNNEGIIKAFAQFKKENTNTEKFSLYIICHMPNNYYKYICNVIKGNGLKVNKDVYVTKYVDDKTLEKLVSQAKACFFPSFLEGLGLPILESYLLNTPVWGSSSSATREILFGECQFNPFDEIDIARAFKEASINERLWHKSLEYGRGIVSRFSWDKIASECIRIIKEE